MHEKGEGFMAGPKGKMRISPMHQINRQLSNMRQALRCGAKTRSGKTCQAPAVWGKRRCRMHGGAHGSGNRKGAANSNFRHGRCTREHMAEMRRVRSFLKMSTEEVLALLGRVDVAPNGEKLAMPATRSSSRSTTPPVAMERVTKSGTTQLAGVA